MRTTTPPRRWSRRSRPRRRASRSPSRPLPDKTYGDPDFTVSATSGSGLRGQLRARAGTAPITGATVHMTGRRAPARSRPRRRATTTTAPRRRSRARSRSKADRRSASARTLTANSACSASFGVARRRRLGMVEYISSSGNISARHDRALHWVTVTAAAGTCTASRYDQADHDRELQRRPAGDRVGQRAARRTRRSSSRCTRRRGRLQRRLHGRGRRRRLRHAATFSSGGDCTNRAQGSR